MQFTSPLSKRLDFNVDSDGHAYFRAWDGRTGLHLSQDEFMALYHLFQDNGEKIAKELDELNNQGNEE